ncbi:MAG: hypothetical protein NZ874_04700 [Fimbriimonadales bacterium]|nr:hypothetical protein [Fimbriimonadales bacterium]
MSVASASSPTLGCGTGSHARASGTDNLVRANAWTRLSKPRTRLGETPKPRKCRRDADAAKNLPAFLNSL